MPANPALPPQPPQEPSPSAPASQAPSPQPPQLPDSPPPQPYQLPISPPPSPPQPLNTRQLVPPPLYRLNPQQRRTIIDAAIDFITNDLPLANPTYTPQQLLAIDRETKTSSPRCGNLQLSQPDREMVCAHLTRAIIQLEQLSCRIPYDICCQVLDKWIFELIDLRTKLMDGNGLITVFRLINPLKAYFQCAKRQYSDCSNAAYVAEHALSHFTSLGYRIFAASS